ncbi:MAG: DEAD/DEAH box helicase family protein [Synergistaceae bacterium]|nr:DEAD/DEAH box helicase family protein [Synergistaceae bacterium]
MELKDYQQAALDNLQRFLDAVDAKKSLRAAYEYFWASQDAEADPPYQDVITGVPRVCFKIPTGGGKTFIAAASLKILCSYVKLNKNKLVVWLVPSDAILTQTLNNLKNPEHAYRARLDKDFNCGVRVYSKDDLLGGAEFSPQSIASNLSVLILSYDSFSGSKRKEWLRSYRDNGTLLKFEPYIKDDELLEDADRLSLVQIIRHYKPVIIVDESHHTGTPLRQEMLANFNPSFILDLTATPRDDANIIYYAPAAELKQAAMVKLPVIVYNRRSRADVIASAVIFRDVLESRGQAEGVRPIVLFQAESKGREDRATFDKVKEDLIKRGVPADAIAIKTANINELKGVDLMSRDCKIKYIITINALKEGWDCPFAYILASLADRKSRVDVEQILGRILRRPFTKNFRDKLLNMCYVFTASEDFHAALKDIVAGLNSAGFSEHELRAAVNDEAVSDERVSELEPEPVSEAASDEIVSVEPEPVNDEAVNELETVSVNNIISVANRLGVAYDDNFNLAVQDFGQSASSLRAGGGKTYAFKIKPRFQADAEKILLPQFFIRIPGNIFGNENYELISRENLCVGFSLELQDANVDFGSINYQLYKVDIDEDTDVPQYKVLSELDSKAFIKYFDGMDINSKRKACAKAIINAVYNDKHNIILKRLVDAPQLQRYLERITAGFDADRIYDAVNNSQAYAALIERKIDTLLAEYAKKNFDSKRDINQILVKPSYKLPSFISPAKNINDIANSLYEAEEDMNNFEQKLAASLASLDNIAWWHKNRVRDSGFYLNGFLNHYPDFIAKTKNNNILIIETKGGHLDNLDSKLKLELGKRWEVMAGGSYKYFMVFDDDSSLNDAVNFNEFMSKAKYF